MQNGDYRASSSPPAFLLYFPPGTAEERNPPAPQSPEEQGKALPPWPRVSVESVSASPQSASVSHPSSSPQQVKKNKLAAKQARRAWLLTACVSALPAPAPHVGFALLQVNLGLLGAGSWLSIPSSPQTGEMQQV